MVVTQRRRHHDVTAASVSATRSWEIRDKILPTVLAGNCDQFEMWPDGDCRRVYDWASSADAARHWTGWAMRNTNNHNQVVLKKSCIGLLVCSRRPVNGCNVRLRPAICSKAREKQLESACPRDGCDGKLTIQKCCGNHGFPVTHFWRAEGLTIYFEAKGSHDHPPPDQRWTRNGLVSATPTTQKCRKRNAVTSEVTSESLPLKKVKPEVESVDFWPVAKAEWTDGSNTSVVSTGSYADDVSAPDVTWDVMASSSPYSVGGSLGMGCWPTGFVTYPSPDPAAGTESSSGYREPLYIHSGLAQSAPEASPHDQWLQASYPINNEDSWPHKTYECDSGQYFSQQYFDSFPDQSLGGVIYESIGGSGGICWPFDSDYMDDVLSVMAKTAYPLIHGVA